MEFEIEYLNKVDKNCYFVKKYIYISYLLTYYWKIILRLNCPLQFIETCNFNYITSYIIIL